MQQQNTQTDEELVPGEALIMGAYSTVYSRLETYAKV
jgi:hypothetical protein